MGIFRPCSAVIRGGYGPARHDFAGFAATPREVLIRFNNVLRFDPAAAERFSEHRM
jgi:hypothetical protein